MGRRVPLREILHIDHWSTVRRRDLRQAVREGSRDPWKRLLEWIGESVSASYGTSEPELLMAVEAFVRAFASQVKQ